MLELGTYTCTHCGLMHMRVPLYQEAAARSRGDTTDLQRCSRCSAPTLLFRRSWPGDAVPGELAPCVIDDSPAFLDLEPFSDCWKMRRAVRAAGLVRVARGLYLHPGDIAAHRVWLLEHIAIAFRPANLVYLSFESHLSEWGAISQIPMLLTVATTGPSELVRTRHGRIEFTHVDGPRDEILARTIVGDPRPLRVASPRMAYEDLVRERRSLGLVDLEELEAVEAEWQSHSNAADEEWNAYFAEVDTDGELSAKPAGTKAACEATVAECLQEQERREEMETKKPAQK